MAIDTMPTIEIKQSPWRMLGIIAIGVGFVATSLFIAWEENIVFKIIGTSGVLFFGLVTAIAIWRLLTELGPVVTVSPTGVRDTRVAAELVPWSAITGVSTWSAFDQPTIVLHMDPEAERRLTLSLVTRFTRRANAAIGADGLCIASQGLKMRHDALLDTITAYWQAAGGGRQ